MPVAAARPAATIVVVRPAAAGVDVLMVKRNDKVAFMAGAYVFPGGRVDDEDGVRARADGTHRQTSRFADLTPIEEQAYRVAAVRELHEEVGVHVTADDLEPIAHWVTPEIEIRRYDTRFFLTLMPSGQEARHDASEAVDSVWIAPAAAIARCRADEILLPPPTWTTLRRLAAFASLEEVMAWARQVPIVRVQPGFSKTEEETVLTLPGDPSYPTLPGWEVPEETRFRLEDGRWRPVRA